MDHACCCNIHNVPVTRNTHLRSLYCLATNFDPGIQVIIRTVIDEQEYKCKLFVLFVALQICATYV